MKKKYHTWVVVGREFDTPTPNIWRCKSCGLYRAAGEPTPSWMQIMEFSAPDGTVLSRGRKAGPPCAGKLV